MRFHKPENLEECLALLSKLNNPWLLAGGTDINVQIKHQQNIHEDIVYINHLPELHLMEIRNGKLFLGAAVTIKELSASELVRKNCPYLSESLTDFASPLISGLATIAGNIANSSPTADTVPLLLVLKAELNLLSAAGSRKVKLKDFYTGYKQNILTDKEIIYAIEIPLQEPDSYSSHYVKVGSRKALTIAKAALALIKYESEFTLAAASVSEYPKRLEHTEKYLNSNDKITSDKLQKILRNDITPISDFRSDAEYRFQVCWNYLLKFLKKTGLEII